MMWTPRQQNLPLISAPKTGQVVPPIFLYLDPGLQKHLGPHKPLHILPGQGGGLFQHSAALANDDALVAVTGQGVGELLDVLEGFLPEGPQLFPEDMASDQPERQMMAEIMREKLLLLLDKEIPHGTAVEITRFAERDDEVVEVEATIYCEKNSHKGITVDLDDLQQLVLLGEGVRLVDGQHGGTAQGLDPGDELPLPLPGNRSHPARK